jgi:CubicO group peptidase (beta-lactamase class C family)
MRRLLPLSLPLSIAAVAAALPIRAQSVDQFAPARAAMQRMVDSLGVASVSVAVAKDGRVIWEHAIGWANREKHIPATPTTIYSLASISKPITATALMILAERGAVDLNKPINAYLGDAKLSAGAGVAESATVRRVLSHTAGLPLHSQFFYSDRGYAPPSMDETIRRYGTVVYPPGRLYEYSNFGYGVIGYVIERVSGASYKDFMRNEVFAPLGMSHTSIDFPAGLEDSVAERYGNSGRPLPFFTFDHVGASSVYSSAHDLVRFSMFHLGNHLPDQRPILRDSTISLMHRVVSPAVDYGLGFTVRTNPFRLAHTGGMPGATTLMVLYPEANLAIVVLANASTRGDRAAQEFAIAGAVAAAVAPASTQGPLGPTMAQSASAPPAFVADPRLVGEWSGSMRTYQGVVPIHLVITSDSIDAFIGEGQRSRVSNLAFTGGRLVGTFAGTMPTDDARRWPHDLALSLLLDDHKLSGAITANSTADRVYFTLSAYAELMKR